MFAPDAGIASTLAGETGEAPITYAGIPRVTGVTNPADPRELEGLPGITQDAGQQLVVRGQGMTGQVLQARLAAIGGGPEAASEQLGVRAPTASRSRRRGAPALDDVRLCTVTGCSTAGHGDRVLVYPPGRPQVTSLSPDSGPAAGGTLVTIGGRNLGLPAFDLVRRPPGGAVHRRTGTRRLRPGHRPDGLLAVRQRTDRSSGDRRNAVQFLLRHRAFTVQGALRLRPLAGTGPGRRLAS